MDPNTPITIAGGKYADRSGAVDDYHAVWGARHEGDFDHTAIAVLTKDAQGNLQVERHDSTTKHLTWGGAILGGALCIVAPPAGVAVVGGLAGAGAIVGHFHHNIPKADVAKASALLDDGESGLVIVAVDKRGEELAPLLEHAEAKFELKTTWGDLDTALEKELAAAGSSSTGSADKTS